MVAGKSAALTCRPSSRKRTVFEALRETPAVTPG
jgi:hypothetical protein